MLFSKNVGPYLSIDEVALSKGELYTFVTNKSGRGRKKTIVASIKGTRSEDIIRVLDKLKKREKDQIIEVTMDMAKNMESSIRTSLPKAYILVDRFHVVKLAIDALQRIRIDYRWQELEIENDAIFKAKNTGQKYYPVVLPNGDTPKQLLARSRYIISKKPNEWTETQNERADILFYRYPAIKEAYMHALLFRSIYEQKDKMKASILFKMWIDKTFDEKQDYFYSVANSVQSHLDNILNFFKTRNTNANAESFNSKIKLFRSNLRGVSDTKFFLFRLANLFA